MAFYNPNKYTDSGARVQVSKNITTAANKTLNVTLSSNVTGNISANISGNASANATQYDKPINSERAEPWETQTHDIVYYRPNKYYAQKNVSANATANVTANSTANSTSNSTANAT